MNLEQVEVHVTFAKCQGLTDPQAGKVREIEQRVVAGRDAVEEGDEPVMGDRPLGAKIRCPK